MIVHHAVVATAAVATAVAAGVIDLRITSNIVVIVVMIVATIV